MAAKYKEITKKYTYPLLKNDNDIKGGFLASNYVRPSKTMFELTLHDNIFTKLPMVQKFFTNCFRGTKVWLSLTELFSTLLELFYVW